MSVWRENAERLIAAIHAELPADADLKARRKALRGAGWPAHQGTAWGRKMWGRCVREYLSRYMPRDQVGSLIFSPTRLDLANAEARRGSAPR